MDRGRAWSEEKAMTPKLEPTFYIVRPELEALL